jgi:hypothetical protein
MTARESQIEKIDRLAKSAGLTRSAFLVWSAIPSRPAKEKKYKYKKAIHEATTLEFLAKRPDFQPYSAKYHTNTTQLAELASKAKPGLLIVYHASIVLRPGLRPQASSPEELLKEVLSGYSGEVVVARDLDVY